MDKAAMLSMVDIAEGLRSNGYVQLPTFVDGSLVAQMTAESETLCADGTPLLHQALGLGDFCRALPTLLAILLRPAMTAWLEAVLGRSPRLVNAVFLDKSLTANWDLPWHQDLWISVKQDGPLSGFGPVSVESGVAQVQAPVHVLERMLILRLHLDACERCRGALHVLPGTHTLGRLSEMEILALAAARKNTVCVAARADALVMRPLLVHMSPRSQSMDSRRIVHLAFAAGELPAPLKWYESLPIRALSPGPRPVSSQH
jgi:hypothetical protein